MATEVITRTLCDVHLQKYDDGNDVVEGKARAISIDGRDYVIDVCTECGAPIEALLELLREYGRSPDATPRPRVSHGAVEPCPAESCTFTGSKAQLRAHARQKHGATLVDLRGETTPYVCPHDGQHFEGNQGLAVHVTRSHGGVWEAEPAAPEPAPKAARGKPRGGGSGKAA